jgi:hypothetical protein
MMGRFFLVAAMVATFAITVACSTAGQGNATSTVTVRTLAQAPVPLPAGKVFVTVLEFSQVPGAVCGPTCYLPGFVYTLHGVAGTSDPGTATGSVSPGNAEYTSTLAVHTNDNVGGRVGAGAIAIGLILIAIVLCAATWLRNGRRRAIIPVLSVLLIAGGVLGLSGATSNDWYFFAVRPDWQRIQPMPRPDGRVVFLSPDVNPVPAAPSLETLSSITVPPGARYDSAGVAGPQTVIVVGGTATVHVGDVVQQLSSGGGDFAQMGTALAIVNSGSDTLTVLDFAVASAGGAAT